MTLTGSQRRLLRWLIRAGEYSRRVWGAELRTAREFEHLGLATCEWRGKDDGWFATVTLAGRSAA